MTANKKATHRNIRILQLFGTLLGLGLSLFLLIHHTELKTGIQDSSSFCSIGKYADCDVVNAGPFSEIFGIPIAALGALLYFTILLLLAAPKEWKEKTQRIISWLAFSGLCVDFILLLVQAVLIHNFCLFCMATYLATAIVLITGLLQQAPPRTPWNKLVYYGLSKKEECEPISQPFLTIMGMALISFVALLFLIPPTIRLKSNSYEYVRRAMETFYQQWREKPVKKIEVKSTDGSLGAPQSKVQIVEFSDFECPFCRKAAFTLHTALKIIKDRVHFTFKNFPLDSSCNSEVSLQMHPHACALSRLAYCASQKNKFWDFHDLVFLGKELPSDEILNEARFAGIFTPEEISKCLKSEESLKNTKDDIKLASTLSVGATPTVFINGKPVTIPLTLENLNRLIEIEEALP